MFKSTAPWAALLCAALLAPLAAAQQPIKPYEEYSKRLRDQEKVAPLKSDLFGENVSMYNGGTEFRVVDVDVPGNGSLSVSLARRFKVEPRKDPDENLGGFGAWDVDVPYLTGTFDAGYKWNEGANSGLTRRCSQLWHPKAVTPFDVRDVWAGFQMHIPGQGDREMLHLETTGNAVPSEGGPYYWAARDDFRFACKPSTANGYPGEGFVAVDAAGTRYTFDVGVERRATTVSKAGGQAGRVKVYLLASRVEDRHGHWVSYTYSTPSGATRPALTRITASDGRLIELDYAGDRIAAARAHGRTWTYRYADGVAGDRSNRAQRRDQLTGVTLPDGASWRYAYEGSLSPIYPFPDVHADARCPETPEVSGSDPLDGRRFVVTATHPAGAIGRFTFDYQRHGRSGTSNECLRDISPFQPPGTEPTYSLVSPDYYDAYSLITKALYADFDATAAGTPSVWTYQYERVSQRAPLPLPCMSCPGTKESTVIEPDGSRTVFTFGARFLDNDGQLLQTRTLAADGAVLRTTATRYQPVSASNPYPAMIGINTGSDDTTSMYHRPVNRTTTTQQGVTFTSDVQQFDAFVRPVRTVRSSTLGYSTAGTQTYYDNTARWVLGQSASMRVDGVAQPVHEVQYDAATDNPATLKQFGEVVQRYGYDAAGMPRTVADGRGNTVTLTDYYRGIPRTITWPTAVSQHADVDAWGKITAATDVLGNTTRYAYDAMSRLARVTPTADEQAWNPTEIAFAPVASAEYGVRAGHWRQTVSTGNRRTVTYLDGLWRPVVSREYDAANEAATSRFVVRRFDHDNRETFASQPTAALSDWTAATRGTRQRYDALGRAVESLQDSEQGTLRSTVAYLDGFRKRTTDPRGLDTLYAFQAFDAPDESAPTSIVQEDAGITTLVQRDVFGKARALTRSGVHGGTEVTSTQRFVYDDQQRLCKRYVPETGADVYAYDAAGNVAWTAEGLPYSGDVCDRDAVASKQRIRRSYDAINRLLTVAYPDGRYDLAFAYEADGQVRRAIAGGVDTEYTYNRRRLLTGETLRFDGWRYGVGHRYDANGAAAGLLYPDGTEAAFAPDALGRPTRSGAYAAGAAYAPGGMLSRFTYANGVAYVASENERQLLSNFTYAAPQGALLLSQDVAYDSDANVVRMSDLLPGAQRTRTMSYDAANRLTSATATGPGMWGVEQFGYDPLDNVRTLTRGGSTYDYRYDGANRLYAVRVGRSTAHSYAYDARGNVTHRDGVAFDFDDAGRLRAVGAGTAYLYDADGHRVRRTENGRTTQFVHSKTGALLFEHDVGSHRFTRHHYLGRRLVARVEGTVAEPATLALTVPAASTTGLYAVTWPAVAGATVYRLEEKTGDGAWVALPDTALLQWSPAAAKANGTYRYRGRACALRCSAYSPEVSVVVTIGATAPATPALTVPALGVDGRYTVGWTTVAGATRYVLEEAAASARDWTTAYDGAAATLAVDGKAPGRYAYRVKACNASACSATSAEGSVQVVYTVASAPTLTLPATSTSGSYAIGWTAVAHAESYRLEETANGGASWTVLQDGAATTREIAGKPAGTYGYRVRGRNAAGDGPLSAVATIQVQQAPLGVPALTAPANTASGSYVVSWTAVSGAVRYELDERTNGGAWTKIHDAAATSRSVSGKPDGTYGYRVRACSASACGAYSATSNVVVAQPPPVPAVPAGLDATANGIGCRVSWQPTAHATRYDLRAAGIDAYSGPESTAFFDAQCATSYTVRACNASGCSAWSGAAQGVPTHAPTIGAPSTSSTGDYAVTWTAIGAERYALEESANGGAWGVVQDDAQTRRDVYGKPSGQYRYRVRACNDAGCGPLSAVVSVQVDVVIAPSDMPSLTVPASSTSGSYAIGWTAVARATRYELQESVNGGTWTPLFDANATGTTVSSRPPAQYDYRVRGCNVSGCGPYSTIRTVQVQSALPVPAVPTGLRVVDSGWSCTVTWNESAPSVTRYDVRDAFGSEPYSGIVPRFDFDAQCAPYYAVRACNANGCSAYSPPAGPTAGKAALNLENDQ